MHEFELGSWKVVFSHLICVLYAVDPSGQLVAQLDSRCVLSTDIIIFASELISTSFQQIPTFGRGVIH